MEPTDSNYRVPIRFQFVIAADIADGTIELVRTDNWPKSGAGLAAGHKLHCYYKKYAYTSK